MFCKHFMDITVKIEKIIRKTNRCYMNFIIFSINKSHMYIFNVKTKP